jgi:Fe-S cluster assembly iron-binding protein IscA
MLSVTSKAAAELKEIMKRENKEGAAVRLFISGVG